jgi:hypothetical protein
MMTVLGRIGLTSEGRRAFAFWTSDNERATWSDIAKLRDVAGAAGNNRAASSQRFA